MLGLYSEQISCGHHNAVLRYSITLCYFLTILIFFSLLFLLHTTIASSSQRGTPYQISALQTPITLSSAQTPSVPIAMSSSRSLSSPTRLLSASFQSMQVSFKSMLTSPAPLPQSHKCLRTIGGKNNVNPNSNESNSVLLLK